jgi:hypothetical protein
MSPLPLWERDLTGESKAPFPLAGEGQDGGRGARFSPPPEPSPIKGEGRSCVLTRRQYLLLAEERDGVRGQMIAS